jgi:DNA-binding IclR family transcriptional regulator
MTGVISLEIVERVVTVLRTLNAFDGVTVSELAKLSGFPRAAVNRYLVTLMNLGYIERDQVSRKYTVTTKALEFSAGAPRDDWITIIVRPHLVAACNVMGWPLSLGTIRNSRLAVLENTDAESPMIVYPMREHIILPLLGRSAGHVLLAFKDKNVREDILKSALIRDPNLFSRKSYKFEHFDEILEEVRTKGFSATKVAGVNWATLSVPVSVNGRVDFSLTSRFHSTALTITEAIERFVEPLQLCSEELSIKLEVNSYENAS